jgi:membrane protein YqaA with SNARE-associated domain
VQLFILFLSAFGAATLLPLQSELVLLNALSKHTHPIGLLIFIATLGNVLGSVVNWILGIYFQRLKDKKWFPFSQDKLAYAQKFYSKYGYWSLLLSFVPIIGDPLTFLAGLMRVNFFKFLLVVTISKLSRYLFIAYVFLAF